MMKNLFFVATLLLLSGCADQVVFDTVNAPESVGFWYGLWHGMILPFAWFVSLFDDSVAIYAIYNNGGWYDFGFFLGLGGLSGMSITVKT